MPESDKLAIAAHLHVLLRRKTGRVTDTEWMAANAEYALEIVRFARLQSAKEDGHARPGRLGRQAGTRGAHAYARCQQTAGATGRAAAAAPQGLACCNTQAPCPRRFTGSTWRKPSRQPAISAGLDLRTPALRSRASMASARCKPKEPDVPRYVGGIR